MDTIFSDEVTFSSTNDGPVRVYRTTGFRHDARYVNRRTKSCGISVSCWGWMSYDGAGYLERIHGKFTHFRDVLVPSARVRFPTDTLLYQQDNHPVHCALEVQRWFRRRHDVDLVEHPPKSSDLNPIEHV